MASHLPVYLLELEKILGILLITQMVKHMASCLWQYITSSKAKYIHSLQSSLHSISITIGSISIMK